MLIRAHELHSKTIKQMSSCGCMKVSDQKQILHKVGKFYQNLFKARGVDKTYSIDSLNNSKSVIKPTKNQSAEFEGKINNRIVISSPKVNEKNKYPGIAGFPAEFNKVFWGKLKVILL